MNENRRTRTSKFLSYALRHAPGEVDLSMNRGGWVRTNELLEAARWEGYELDRSGLRTLIRASEKERFELSAEGDLVRATYGHSVDVDLDLTPVDPPERLFHGTAMRFLSAIEEEGLRPGNRNYVHLSETRAAARSVGGRHGRPVVLSVEARGLAREGQPFFRSADGVWMTPAVPPDRLAHPDEDREEGADESNDDS